MSSRKRILLLEGVALLSLICATGAQGGVPDIVNRVPSGANAIAYINVDSLLNSKLGQQEKWRDQMSDAYATRPIMVPPDATHVLMASWIEPVGVNPIWEVAVIETTQNVSVDRIARDASGFVEILGGKRASWTPTNAYYVKLDNHILGVVCPADRQFATRWGSQTGSMAGTLSPYLSEAAKRITPRTGFLFAFDLQDAVSEKRFRKRLDMEEFESLSGAKIDAHKVSEAVASIRGLTLAVEVTGDITGTCVIELGKPATDIISITKPLVIEILERTGASIADFASWQFTADGNAITAAGALSTEGLRQLCSIINPPSPTGIDDAPEGSASLSGDKEKAEKAGTANAAAASQRYYRAVSKIIDTFAARVRKASSLTQGATYVARDARNIGRLPILNVDPALIEWGASVNSRLMEVATSLGVGGLQARARSESVLDPYSNDATVTYYLEVKNDQNNVVDRQNAARQRRAAVAEEKGKILQQATQQLMEIEAARAKIRAAMAAKYSVEF